ncbi:Hypothetical predicted protein [Paramuricea clavata]|uniref:Uncharacterized protein n=1 Tax=Paramuricea clavata TaxID=317549 RepID=A0A6S7JAT7_PARCT|nr:Hypothetical predicted protein [Paramuricea clavata]
MHLLLKTGKRFDVPAMQTFCVRQSGECFIRCLGKSKCQSFGIGVVDECLGQLQCRLYSQVEISDLTNDTKFTYYILKGSSCCINVSCLNGGLCRSKVCTCACTKDFMSTNCICPRNNVTRQFSHKWKAVKGTGAITQIDSGGGRTWATRIDNEYIFALQNGAWTQVDGLLSHATVGKSGVWGLNKDDEIFFRLGVTPDTPSGTGWQKLYGLLKQIDAGSSGVVYGVNRYYFLHLFINISD